MKTALSYLWHCCNVIEWRRSRGLSWTMERRNWSVMEVMNWRWIVWRLWLTSSNLRVSSVILHPIVFNILNSTRFSNECLEQKSVLQNERIRDSFNICSLGQCSPIALTSTNLNFSSLRSSNLLPRCSRIGSTFSWKYTVYWVKLEFPNSSLVNLSKWSIFSRTWLVRSHFIIL